MTSGVVASTFDRFGALTSDIAQQGPLGRPEGFIRRTRPRIFADVRRLHRQALRAAARGGHVSACDGGIMVAAGLTMLANAFWTEPIN
jgi:hypothetical protein